MPSHVSNFKCDLFANDTVLSLSVKSVFDLKKVNPELINIDNWLKCSKLSLNYSRTQYADKKNKKS